MSCNQYIILPNEDILIHGYFSLYDKYIYRLIREKNGRYFYADLQNEAEIPMSELQDRVIDVLRVKVDQLEKE